MEGPGFAVALDAADVICIAVAAASSSTSSATAHNEQVFSDQVLGVEYCRHFGLGNWETGRTKPIWPRRFFATLNERPSGLLVYTTRINGR